MTFENDWCFRTAMKRTYKNTSVSKFGSFLSPNDKSICLRNIQKMLHQWVVVMPCRAPGPSRHCCFWEHISSVCFAMWAATSKASAEELDLLCGSVQKAVLTCKSQDFPPIFSSVPAVWCTIISIPGSLLVQQSKLSTVTLCSFLIPIVGFFWFSFSLPVKLERGYS